MSAALVGGALDTLQIQGKSTNLLADGSASGTEAVLTRLTRDVIGVSKQLALDAAMVVSLARLVAALCLHQFLPVTAAIRQSFRPRFRSPIDRAIGKWFVLPMVAKKS